MSDHHIIFQLVDNTFSAASQGTPSSTSPHATAPNKKAKTFVSPDSQNATEVSDSSVLAAIKTTVSAASSPASFALSKVTSAVPYVAIAFLAAEGAEKVVSVSSQFASIRGDNSLAMGYSNFSKVKGAIFNPVGFGISLAEQAERINAQNQTQSQLRDLAGDSSSNTFYKKGA